MKIEIYKTFYNISRTLGGLLETAYKYVMVFIDSKIFCFSNFMELICETVKVIIPNNVKYDYSLIPLDKYYYNENGFRDKFDQLYKKCKLYINTMSVKDIIYKDEEYTKFGWYREERYEDASFTSFSIALQPEFPVIPACVGIGQVSIDFFFRIVYYNDEGEKTYRYCDSYTVNIDDTDQNGEGFSFIYFFTTSPVSIHVSIGPDITLGVPWVNFAIGWGSKTGLDMRGFSEKFLLWDINILNIPSDKGFWDVWIKGSEEIIKLNLWEIGFGIYFSFCVVSNVMYFHWKEE